MQIFLNYYFVNHLSSGIFLLLIISYVLLNRQKNRVSWAITAFFITLLSLPIGHGLWNTIFSENIANAGAATANLYIVSTVSALIFAYELPRNIHPVESKISIGICSLLAFFAYFHFLNGWFSEGNYYNFDTHLYLAVAEVKAQALYSIVATLLILWSLVVFFRKILYFSRFPEEYLENIYRNRGGIATFFISIRLFFSRLIFVQGKEAAAVQGFGIAYFIGFLLSSLFAIYSQGYITWETYQIGLTSGLTIMYFVYAVIYINHSPQPTSFMVKLVGISLVTLIVVLTASSILFFGLAEKYYDMQRIADINKIKEELRKPDKRSFPSEMKYLGIRPGEQYFANDVKVLWPVGERINGSLITAGENQMKEIMNRAMVTRQTQLHGESLDLATKTAEAHVYTKNLEYLVRRYKYVSLKEQETFFVYYMFRHEGRIYEAGFSYLGYRAYVHENVKAFVYIIIGSFAFILLIFPMFFMTNLVAPLRKLLEGVSLVNHGELDVKVRVQVEDEIGYLSRSFNSMVDSIRESRAKLEEHAGQLEVKVKERTKDLRKALDVTKKLKNQQDGDYFLTSLLIKPLAANEAPDGSVKVDFFTRQKKQFRFRKWHEEIGGDLNKAHKIKLKGIPHTVFLNADAMGKSMQGAGGVLVMGAVFESLIERTKLSSVVQDQYPERWLKNAFIELHKVFESFDGSMLISAIIGIVDDLNGFMYYMNAEHPFLVLYRNGRAEFLDEELGYRKLGTTGITGSLGVRTFQMEIGDAIIAGTDGRDDIIMGYDEDGYVIINDDETAFLRRVEENRGNLNGVYRSLKSMGGIYDDICMLKVVFEGEEKILESYTLDEKGAEVLDSVYALKSNKNLPEAIRILEEENKRRPYQTEVLQLLFELHIRRREFVKASLYAEDYVCLRPDDTRMIYVTSLCFAKIGDYRHAADLSERVRLRKPGLIKNLSHLARVNIKLGNFNRARMIIKDVLESNPNNLSALLIQRSIISRGSVE